METTYMNIDANYVTVFGDQKEQVSGGSRLCYTRVPRRVEPHGQWEEKVIDLEAYRRQYMEVQAEEIPREVESTPAPMGLRDRVGLLLDICATGAIVCATIWVVLRFFAG